MLNSTPFQTLQRARNITIPHDRLADFCRRWKITEFALFGSVLRDDFRPDSDIDVLVTFAEDAQWSLSNHVGMEEELEKLFGRKVDLVGRENLKNPFMRCEILKSLENPALPANPDLAYFWIVRENAQNVMRFTEGATWETFRQDDMLKAATAFSLERLGEATKKISQKTKDTHLEVSWNRFANLNRLLNYRYVEVNLEPIWDIIRNDVPILLQMVEALLPPKPIERQI